MNEIVMDLDRSAHRDLSSLNHTISYPVTRPSAVSH